MKNLTYRDLVDVQGAPSSTACALLAGLPAAALIHRAKRAHRAGLCTLVAEVRAEFQRRRAAKVA